MLTLVFASVLAATPAPATGNVSAVLLQPSHALTLVADDPKNNNTQDASGQSFDPRDSHRIG
jgi:hypothetical protein